MYKTFKNHQIMNILQFSFNQWKDRWSDINIVYRYDKCVLNIYEAFKCKCKKVIKSILKYVVLHIKKWFLHKSSRNFIRSNTNCFTMWKISLHIIFF